MIQIENRGRETRNGKDWRSKLIVPVVVWAGGDSKLARIGLFDFVNPISRVSIDMFEIVRNNSCVNTEVSSPDTGKSPILAILLCRDWISACRD
jgi:hypothetical protein